jgi:ABC-2 type transport system permease protein
MKPLSALVRTDLRLYFSNRRALAITLAAPILIGAFFGAVLGGGPKKAARVPVAVMDQDQSEMTKGIVASMKADDNFDVREISEADALEGVRNGKLRAAIVLPKGFGEKAPRALFRSGEKPAITVHLDPSQSMTLALVKGLLAQHVMESVTRNAFGRGASGVKAIADARADVERSSAIDPADRRDLMTLFDSVARLQSRATLPASTTAGAGPGSLQMPFTTDEREVTGKVDRKYNAYAHSFAGMAVQFVLFMGIEIGVGVLYMRRMGLWKRLRAAPVSKRLLLGSRVVSGTLIAFILVTAIYAAAMAFFGVRVDGSWAGLALVAFAFAVMSATFGLLIASLGRSPEAARGLAILATLLLVMLGGAWVPTFVFPEWLQSATLVVPTRWAVDGLEAMTWRGLDFSAALLPIGVLLAFSAAFATIAMASFKWEE